MLNNKNYGIHVFIVPLRDCKTGRTYPGISIGDLGIECTAILKIDKVDKLNN